MENLDKVISVIIPVYNIEKYIEECIDSLTRQTYTYLDIILVDDGSTDQSGNICDVYATKDKRIRSFHKRNGGLSDARNYGLTYVKGAYVSFVDGDDYLDEDMYEYLIQLMDDNKADISACGYKKIYKDHSEGFNENKIMLMTSEEALYMILADHSHYQLQNAVWNKLYKKDLLRNITFPVGKNYEDIMFTVEVFNRAPKVVYGTSTKYNYRIEREGSIMNDGFGARKITDELPLLYERILFFKNKNISLLRIVVSQYFECIMNDYWYITQKKSKALYQYREELIKKAEDFHLFKQVINKKLEWKIIVFIQYPLLICLLKNIKKIVFHKLQKGEK